MRFLLQPDWLNKDQASNEDIAHLLDRAWIRRIWTLQEVILSTESIVVCGSYHLHWSQFVWSVIALKDYIHRQDDVVLGLSRIISPWLSTGEAYFRHMEAKALASRKPIEPSLGAYSTNLQAWENFVGSFQRVREPFDKIVLFHCIGVCFALIVIAAPLTVLSIHSAGIVLIILASVAALVFFTVISIVGRFGKKIIHGQTSVQAQWADLIMSRCATEPKDKAFGVYAIVQSYLPDSQPAPNYSLANEIIFKDLCFSLLDLSNSLRFLLAASMKESSVAPSWVPDWSSETSKLWGTASLDMHQDRSFWEYSGNDPDALVVLGRQFSVVKSVVDFEDPHLGCASDEAHIRNLRTMIALANGPKGDRLECLLPAKTLEVIWDATESTAESAAPKVSVDDFYFWLKVLSEMKVEEAELVARQWRRRSNWRFNLHILGWRYFASKNWIHAPSTLFQNHMLTLTDQLCARMARTGCCFLMCTNSDNQSELYLGTPKAQPGDRVVYIMGAGMFTIRGDDKNARLIGPAISTEAHMSNWLGWPLDLTNRKLVKLRLV